MNAHKLLFIITLSFCLLVACQSSTTDSKSLDTFQLHDGFQLELIASEPLVSDPVDMEIDEEGRMMVVEMHGYPLDLSGSGVLRELIDTDNDGLPDDSVVFADGLVLPTGIMKWKTGWLVTDPPHVLFFEDTDRDGRADVRDTILVGFARSNPQHNVNSPVFGLDNWIYVSHEGAIQTKLFEELLGDEGEEVRYFNRHDGARLPRNANGLAVRFKPDSYELESLSARGQFGQTFDSWGHHFVTSNADHLFHIVMDAKHVNRNTDLMLSSSRQYMPSTGKGFDIYPTTISPEHQLLTDIGVITSACGIIWYNGGLFPKAFNNSIFTAEPVHNLIHVDAITDNGATFQSNNIVKDKEFLSSTDSWFRPVNHYIGPDGAIYILDYHRKIIEHPEWLSDEITQSDDLTAGTDMGRIYRLTPKGTLPMSFLNRITLSSQNTDELIHTLAHGNIWWRRHAQRLLMDKKHEIEIPYLVEFLETTKSPEARVHAAWLLDGMQQLDEEHLIALCNDEVAGVRENALKIAEDHLINKPSLLPEILDLANDPDPKVRFQALLVLGNSDEPQAVTARLQILLKDIEDPWIHLAALSASALDVETLLKMSSKALENQESPEAADFFKRLGELFIRKSSIKQSNAIIKKMCTSDGDKWYASDILNGVSKALQHNGDFVLSASNQQIIHAALSGDLDVERREGLVNLLAAANYFEDEDNLLAQRAKGLLDTDFGESEYAVIEAVDIIARSAPERYLNELRHTFLKSDSDQIRMASLKAMCSIDQDDISELLINEWDNFSIEERHQSIQYFLKNDMNKIRLLDNIQKDLIQTSNLSWPQKVSLLNSSHPQIRPLARSLLQGSQLKTDEIWNQFEPALSMLGDVAIGNDVFKLKCGTCHQISGTNGVAFGPDLASVRNRNKAALLLDILQPNRAIADGYELYTIKLHSGNQFVGMLNEEGTNSITIRDASGDDTTILREEIATMTVAEYSAMQEGLHTQLSLEDMANLLAYLKKPNPI